MSVEAQQKPPTIRVGVEGIDAAKQKGDAGYAEPAPIDWAHIFALPPFQMFVNEKYGQNVADPALLIRATGEAALYQSYCDWHKAKGYWPNETPTGELISHVN